MGFKQDKFFTSKPLMTKPFVRKKQGFEEVPPNSGPDGRIIGSASSKKGVKSTKSLIKHDGIVMGGSVTNERKTASKKSIDKLSSGGSTRIIGSG